MSVSGSDSGSQPDAREWEMINRREAEDLRARNAALSPAERLDLGQELSRQAMSLLVASVKAGHAPRRALWP